MENALTVDVEDYFQVSAFESVIRFTDWNQFESRVEKNTHSLLDLFDRCETKATFFVLGWIAERQPGLVRAIQERGHEVASHGYSHRRIYTQRPEEFQHETRRAKHVLEDICGHEIIGYRAASYSITVQSMWALDVLADEGFLYDSSIFPVRHDVYGIPEAPRFTHTRQLTAGVIREYPLSTISIGKFNLPIAGGGYLRFFPYRLTRWAITRLNQIEKQPAIVYLHPWEVDPNQPRIRARWRSRFRHYINLHKTKEIVTGLLSDFRFCPMRELYRRDTLAIKGS